MGYKYRILTAYAHSVENDGIDPRRNCAEKIMQLLKWACVLLVLMATCVWAQQAAAPVQPEQNVSNIDSSVQYKPAPSPPKGSIWSCPGKLEFHPEVDGVYKVGGSVKPETIKNNVDAEFSDEAMQESGRNPNFSATSVLYLVVDTEGIPQDICINKLAGYGLDLQAVIAVKQYRFRPATKDGKPVSVRIMLEVNFRR